MTTGRMKPVVGASALFAPGALPNMSVMQANNRSSSEGSLHTRVELLRWCPKIRWCRHSVASVFTQQVGGVLAAGAILTISSSSMPVYQSHLLLGLEL